MTEFNDHGDYWRYGKPFHDLIRSVRIAERQRAAEIVEKAEYYTPYIVGQMKIDGLKTHLAKAIRGEN